MRGLFIQQLERREVFNGSAVLENGILTVQGDDLSNEILVSANVDANKLTVKIDTMVFDFRNEAVKHIQVFSKNGNDSIAIAASIRQTTRLDGGKGNDQIFGSSQPDVILGGDGNDRLLGNGGADRIEGGGGNDRIAGGDGNDNIQGGLGNDLIRGGGGNDELFGDGVNEQEGPVSDDDLSFSEALARTAALRRQNPENSEEPGAPELESSSPETDSNDVIYGDDGDDIIRAGIGNDVVYGGNGNDSVDGGAGVDFLEGQDGNDRLGGGAGADVIFAGTGNDQLGGGRGNDFLIGGAGNDEFEGGAGNDWLFGDGTNSYPEEFTDPVRYAVEFAMLNRGNDALLGGEGNDILLAGNGNDRADGGNGNDVLVGGEGNDGLKGGDGNDIILGDYRMDGDDVSEDILTMISARSGVARSLLERISLASTLDPNLMM